MRVLTLTQPWASLVVWGAKQWETRGWYRSHRGPLAIHAAKAYPQWAQRLCYTSPFREVLAHWGWMSPHGCPDLLPRGVILGTVNVDDWVRVETVRDTLSPQERAFGDYTDTRFAVKLSSPRELVQRIPARGALGLWTFDHPALEQLATADVARMA